MGMTLGVGLLALSMLVPSVTATMVGQMQMAVVDMSPQTSNQQLLDLTGGVLITLLGLILPLAVLVMIAGVAGNLISGGLVLSPKAIRFDLQRINPLSGLKRMADRQAMVRLGLAAAKLAILAVISWQVVGSRVPSILDSEGSSASVIAGTCLAAVFQLGLTITILLAVVALVDFVVQRRKAQQAIRMTKQEVKQEFREQEGDPLVRGARRRRARQIAFARMMDAVPTSDVVVTNPTTLAVALKYDSLTMRAPKIVAKGQRLMADRIKAIAREHNVPVIEDKPLARALFPRPIGSEVQAHLYRAVARLLVLVHQTRFGGSGRGGRRGPQGRTQGGFAARPWWGSASGPGLPAMLGSQIAAVAATDSTGSRADATVGSSSTGTGSSAAGQNGATAAGKADPNVHSSADDRPDRDPGWLDDAALTPEDVDEEALAAAMAADELGDMTPEELTQIEAGLVLGEDDDETADEEFEQ